MTMTKIMAMLMMMFFNVRATVSKVLARITQDVKVDLRTKVSAVFAQLDSKVKDAVKVTRALMSIF